MMTKKTGTTLTPVGLSLMTRGMANGKTQRATRYVEGKALIAVDAVLDIRGERAYDVWPSIQSGRGTYNEDAFLELSNVTRKDDFFPPNQCKRMAIGDRWRLAVKYRITYEPTIDREGNEDWDVIVEFLKAKTLRKSPWRDNKHKRYVSKSKR